MPSNITLPHLLMTDCSVPEVNPSCSKTVAAWSGTQRDAVRQGGGACGALSEGAVQGSVEDQDLGEGGPLVPNWVSYARGGKGCASRVAPVKWCQVGKPELQ